MKRNTVKRNVSLALGAALVFGAVPVYAADAVTVNLNGSQMEFDVNPVIENSRTLCRSERFLKHWIVLFPIRRRMARRWLRQTEGNKWITLEIGKTKSPLNAKQRSWMLRRKS